MIERRVYYRLSLAKVKNHGLEFCQSAPARRCYIRLRAREEHAREDLRSFQRRFRFVEFAIIVTSYRNAVLPRLYR